MTTIARSVLAAILVAGLFVQGVAAQSPAEAAARGAGTPAVGEPEVEAGFPTWGKWVIFGVVAATAIALLFAFVIVPEAIEDSVESAEPCCDENGGGPLG